MLRVVIAVSLVACSSHARGPAWPKQTVKEADGGESLEPRTPAAIAAIEETDDTPVVLDKVETKSDKADKPKDATPETPKGTAHTVPEEPITTEDIVIEIDD